MSSLVLASNTTKSSPFLTILARSAKVTYALEAVLYRRRLAYFLMVVGGAFVISSWVPGYARLVGHNRIGAFCAARNLFLRCNAGDRRRHPCRFDPAHDNLYSDSRRVQRPSCRRPRSIHLRL